MKNLFLLGCIALLFSCAPKDTVKISGNVKNSSSNMIIISNQLHNTVDTLELTDGNFSDILKVNQPGLYYLKNDQLGLQLYLKPGSDIKIDIDIEELKKNNYSDILISGDGYKESKLMFDLKKYDLSEGLRNILKMPSDSFETLIKNNYSEIVQTIDSFKTLKLSSEHFYSRIEILKKIELNTNYMYYCQYHKYLTPSDTLPIPSRFYSMGDDIPLDNETFYNELDSYKEFVLQKLDSKIQKQLTELQLNNESLEYTTKQIDLIIALNVSQNIKDELGNSTLLPYSYATNDVKEVLKNRYQEIVKNEDYIKEFKASVAIVDALTPGNKAPSFSYSDIDGKLINSDDLKGKIIYVDVWATWCGPCKGEIPYLKKLEEDLHKLDIAFVSISVDDDKQAWQNMVKEKELKGYQLHANKGWNSTIIRDYAIKGIPQFILIDKEGKLIEANAKRPSDTEIKNQLIKLAKS